MMQQTQYEQKQHLAFVVVDEAFAVGSYSNSQYDMTIDGAEIKVRDKRTGLLVGYSSTKADFKSSLEEFAWDFFTQGE